MLAADAQTKSKIAPGGIAQSASFPSLVETSPCTSRSVRDSNVRSATADRHAEPSKSLRVPEHNGATGALIEVSRIPAALPTTTCV
jgi:hypothetical protein